MNSKKYKDTLYKMRYINDLRDMIVSSAELYADDPAFLVKDTHSDPYRPITFRTLKEDIDSFGTKLSALGLRDKKVALIGENSYEWVVSYSRQGSAGRRSHEPAQQIGSRCSYLFRQTEEKDHGSHEELQQRNHHDKHRLWRGGNRHIQVELSS